MGLKLGKDFLEKDASAYLKDALKGASKTKKQTGTGIPDFVIEKYKVDNEIIPVIFECKLGVGKLEKYAKDNEKALDFSNDAISKTPLMVLCIMQGWHCKMKVKSKTSTKKSSP